MPDKIPNIYGLWGALALTLAAHGLWCAYFAYPATLERMLRKGRPWVYIPLAWTGFRKLRDLWVGRLLLVAGAGLWATLLAHHAGKRHALWIAGFFVLGYAGFSWLHTFWCTLRFKQQEDVYYLLYDELRARMEAENKDFTEAQLRSLAAYQHQQRLRKADEEGKFLAALGAEARRSRQARMVAPPPPQAAET